jgi:hypothetical protein
MFMSDDVDRSWAFVDLVNSRQIEPRRFGRRTKGRRRIQTTPMMVVDSANATGRRTAGRAGVLAHRHPPFGKICDLRGTIGLRQGRLRGFLRRISVATSVASHAVAPAIDVGRLAQLPEPGGAMRRIPHLQGILVVRPAKPAC